MSPFPVTFRILKELMAQIKSHLKIILKRNVFFKELWSHQGNADFHWLWYINYGKTERQVFQKKARRCGTIVLKETGSVWMIPVSCKCSIWVGLVNVWISFSNWAPALEPPSEDEASCYDAAAMFVCERMSKRKGSSAAAFQQKRSESNYSILKIKLWVVYLANKSTVINKSNSKRTQETHLRDIFKHFSEKEKNLKHNFPSTNCLPCFTSRPGLLRTGPGLGTCQASARSSLSCRPNWTFQTGFSSHL